MVLFALFDLSHLSVHVIDEPSTVTMGIISGLKRSSEVVGLVHKKVDFIQTDAAINPGNR